MASPGQAIIAETRAPAPWNEQRLPPAPMVTQNGLGTDASLAMMLVSGQISRRTALGRALVRRPSGRRATTFGRQGDPMRRRQLVLLLGGAMMTSRILRAQQKAMPVIGLLGSSSPGPNAANVAAFRQGLSEIGYVEGQNLAIEYRWAEGHYDWLPH